MNNLNLAFNKSYFLNLGDDTFANDLKKRNEQLYNVIFSEEDFEEAKLEPAVCPRQHRFWLKSTYPGLLVGTGYAHEVEQGANDCIKLGFSFDYVTGQPYIPGSSVKGMLHSCFEQPEIAKELFPSFDSAARKALTTDIFDGGDIFFDAVLRCGDKHGHVIGKDYITPHGVDETKSPTPLLMIKIMPDVVFEFRFKLHDFTYAKDATTVTALTKLSMFKQLIEVFGIGAKTNVGYGTLVESSEDEAKESLKRIREQRQAVAISGLPERRTRQSAASDVQRTTPPGGGICAVASCRNRTTGTYILCRSCSIQAQQTGLCAICGSKTKINAINGRHYQMCSRCNRQYNPRTKRY